MSRWPLTLMIRNKLRKSPAYSSKKSILTNDCCNCNWLAQSVNERYCHDLTPNKKATIPYPHLTVIRMNRTPVMNLGWLENSVENKSRLATQKCTNKSEQKYNQLTSFWESTGLIQLVSLIIQRRLAVTNQATIDVNSRIDPFFNFSFFFRNVATLVSTKNTTLFPLRLVSIDTSRS